jgi:hypothetical protein
MDETECTNSRGLSCHALVAAVAKVSYQRFRDARVLFDPIIREAALFRMQELGMDMSRRFDRPEDAIHHFTEFTPDVHDFSITTTQGVHFGMRARSWIRKSEWLRDVPRRSYCCR